MATNSNTDQKPTTLPTTQELTAAYRELCDVTETLCHLQWRVQRIAREAQIGDYPTIELVEGAEIPTHAHIGELYVFLLDARARLAESESYLSTIEERLEDLDTVKRMHEADDA